MVKKEKQALIIGAGPAGLTAALELLNKTESTPVIIERSNQVGGISKTVKYKNNRMDIGGHRFFSKTEKIMDWWLSIFPIQGAPAKDDLILRTQKDFSKKKRAPDPEKEDDVMLLRNRVSRIYYDGKFFDYPVSLSLDTLKKLGLKKIIKIMITYLQAKIFYSKKNIKNLEDFFIDRFGKELYETFFKDYTKKVWGVSCSDIGPEWGFQRVKGVSVIKTVIDNFRQLFKLKQGTISQKKTETSLIRQFLYPKYGPGQFWEKIAKKVEDKGGRILFSHEVTSLKVRNKKIETVVAKDLTKGRKEEFDSDYFLSSMPVQDLIKGIKPETEVPESVRRIAEGLEYRSFITVGVLLEKIKLDNYSDIDTVNDIIPDNWIYVQDKNVKVGRIQVFNNWSPYLLEDINDVWLGLEYFCDQEDKLWEKEDNILEDMAIEELEKMNFIDKKDVKDTTVIRVPKTYPAYFGSYARFGEIRRYTDEIENLFLIGRNGTHKYNNMDHSMLTAMKTVDLIKKGIKDKEEIWQVNTEKEYHETK